MKTKINTIIAALLLLILFSAAIRFAFLLNNYHFLWWDVAVYLAMGDAFAGNLYYFEFFRPPLWPLLLAAVPKTFLAAKILSIAVSVATIPVIFFLSRKMLGGKKALFISFFYTINQASALYSVMGGSESLAIFLLFISFLSAYSAVRKGGNINWFIAGASIALAAMTRHIAAYFIIPLLLFFLYYKGLKIFRERGFWLFLASGILFISPWLIAMALLFGNPLYSQMYNLSIVGYVEPQYYLGILPIFLGIQGLFIIPPLFNLKKDKFALFSALSVFLGFLILSAIGYKEDRYLMVLIPGAVSLEGLGLFWFAEKLKIKQKMITSILVCVAALVFIVAALTPTALPDDRELTSCIEMSGRYANNSVITTSSPYLALAYKKSYLQLPWRAEEFSCNSLKQSKSEYVIYFEDWFYSNLKEDFLAKTSSCLELLESKGKCSFYRVIYT